MEGVGWGGGGGRGGGYGPFKNSSLISNRSFIKGGRKPENPGENHLTIRKQILAFLRVTRVRLEPSPAERRYILSLQIV